MKKETKTTVREALQDPLATFKWFERTLAVFLFSIPLILHWTDKQSNGINNPGFRDSISNYVYMWHSYVFGLLLGAASLLFIFNGVIYFRNENKRRIKVDSSGKWYNLALGICLLGVTIFPHLEYPVVHYIFAGAFFLGNAIVTGIFHTETWRKSNTFLAIMTVLGLVIYFLDDHWLHLFPGYTLFWAEWISIGAVAVHFFLDSLDDKLLS